MSSLNTTFLNTAEKAAKAAGAFLKTNYGKTHIVDEALHHDLKLALDKESQDLIFAILQNDFPEHALLGEEGIGGTEDSNYRWVVDPIDGTVNYFYGIPHFCVSIGLQHNGVMIVGVIYDPMTDQCWTVEKGQPAYLNGEQISVSSRTRIEESILYVGSGKTEDSLKSGIDRFEKASKKARKMRMMGSAALALAYVASGRLDAYIEGRISLWDIAAGQLLVEAAGGKVELSPSPTEENVYSIVSSNGTIPLEEIL